MVAKAVVSMAVNGGFDVRGGGGRDQIFDAKSKWQEEDQQTKK